VIQVKEKKSRRKTTARSRGRPPLPDSELLDRHEKIVEAAFKMFSAKGFADTTLDAIGRDAGVTKRTIYELIGDKVAVFHAACDRMRVRGRHFAFDVQMLDRPTCEILRQMARQLVDHSLHPDLIALERAITQELSHSPKLVSEVVAGGKAKLNQELAKMFATLATGDERIKTSDFETAADVFYDITVGARGFRAAMGHTEILTDDALFQRVDAFWYGYLARPTPPTRS
jgi:AcrR family transcriptional regulator